MNKGKQQIVKRVSMDDEEDGKVRIGDDMQAMAEGMEEPEAMLVTLPNDPAEQERVERAINSQGPGQIIRADDLKFRILVANKPLLTRAQVFLLEYSHSGRGARCPECAQIIGHGDKCKLNKLIVEI